jgi:ABC-type branched-subunit amino acid transport system substrate-binding protein
MRILRWRTAIGVSLVCVLLAGCGSRLSADQRAQLVGQGQPGGAGNGGLPTQGAGGGPAASNQPGGAQQPGGAGGSRPGPGPGGSGGGGSGPGPAGAAGCTARGGATAPGVTADTVTIANASDVSGPIPGIFESAQQAVKAYVAYFNATQKLCGRALKLISLDSRTDAGGDQQATLQACQQAFAMVGSMSAFDQGGGAAAAGCGIPDLRAASVTSQRQHVAVSYGVNSTKVNLVAAAIPEMLRQRYPAAVKSAAFLYLNAAAAQQNAQSWIRAYGSHGITYTYTQAIDIADFNYAPYVTQLKQKGIRLVQWLGSAQYALRLQQAMQQQGYHPDVFFTDPTGYDQVYAEQGGATVNGTVVFTDSSLVDDSNPELNLYRQWLAQVAPGARPTYFGMYAWGAARLFTTLAAEVGPTLTRAALLAKVRGVHGYTANGLFAPQDVGGKRTSACAALIQLNGGRFARLTPSRGYTCHGLLDSGVGA